MRWRIVIPVLALGGLVLALPAGRAEAQGSLNFDESILKAGGVGPDDASLLEYLRGRAPVGADPANVELLVQQLGSKKFAERERAARVLVQQGARVLPWLHKGKQVADKEAAKRAAACIEEIERPDPYLNVMPAVIRTVVKRRPPGAVEALLQYLPFAPDESLEEEALYALYALALRDGKLEPALVKALGDPLPARRAAAGCIVGRRGDEKQRQAVRKLLEDGSPLVRLRAAQGLLAGGDKSGLAALVVLVAEPDIPLAWQAEELLHWVAGDEAPAAKVGAGSAEQRQKCRAAWQAWWQHHGAKVDLAQLMQHPRRPGLLLATRPGSTFGIELLGCDGQPRFQLSLPKCFEPVYWLSGGRLLVGAKEASDDPYPSDGVAVYDLHGKLLWSRGRRPAVCQPLPNGSIFLSADQWLCNPPLTNKWVFGPTGKEVFRHHCHEQEVKQASDTFLGLKSAYHLGNGQLLCLANRRRGVADPWEIGLLDMKSGKPVRRAQTAKFERTNRVETVSARAMPDGSWAILAVRERTEGEGQGYRLHRTVEEWDLDGKVVKQWSWQWYSATWLRNGNLLLRDYRLFEQDHKGKVLWEVFREKGFGNVQVCLGLVRLGFSDSRPPDADLNAVANRIKGLQSKDVLERRWSARELERLKTKAAPAAAALTKALEDPEDLVVGAAVDALQVIGPSAVPELLRTLKHNNPEVRWRAAWCLGAYPNEAKAITPALIAATKDEHAIVRGIAASMLGRMKTEAAKAVPVLIGLLRDSQANVRRRAALALGHLGPAAREAVPVLRELSGSGEHPVASHAVEALKLIQGEK